MKSEAETELEHRSETSDTSKHAVHMFSERVCNTLVINLFLIIIIYVRNTPATMKKNIV